MPTAILTERAPGFVYRGRGSRHLHAERVAVAKLAQKLGTPLYVYSAATINERYDAFEHAFRDVQHSICYSVKANSNLGILRLLAKKGCGFDVVSGGELERVLRISRPAARLAKVQLTDAAPNANPRVAGSISGE